MTDPTFDEMMAGPDPRQTMVVNLRTEAFDVYIGRGRNNAIFGNPYFIGADGDREEVISLYREWLKEGKASRARAVMAAVEAGTITGKRLGCFCRPEPCHGDVLVELDREFHGCAFTMSADFGHLDLCSAPGERCDAERKILCSKHRDLVRSQKWADFKGEQG